MGPGTSSNRAIDWTAGKEPAVPVRKGSDVNVSKILATSVVATGLACSAATARAGAPDPVSADAIARGRYVVVLSHCNNCHTAGYAAREGDVPESQWLTGNPVGWRGQSGTVYAINLRLFLQDLSEEDWLRVARDGRGRPPMPWWSLRETSEGDLRAMYRYIRSLKPVGTPAPAALSADQEPAPPYNQLPDMSVKR
ncbi:MAG: cytochrome C [Betaproteobacteria bacterium]